MRGYDVLHLANMQSHATLAAAVEDAAAAAEMRCDRRREAVCGSETVCITAFRSQIAAAAVRAQRALAMSNSS